jgi:CheY-like chemotaxis protein
VFFPGKVDGAPIRCPSGIPAAAGRDRLGRSAPQPQCATALVAPDGQERDRAPIGRAVARAGHAAAWVPKEAGKGTGLGLAIAYGIVKQSGGHVSVYSEPDHGTTFKIYLPRCDAPAQRAGTLLLLEDEDALRLVIAEVLEESGYEVITTAVPEEALQAGLSHPGQIDLLLTDVVMPQVSGRDAFERLKAAQPTVRALYMSGYTNEVINHNGVLDAGTSFIQKPFAFDAVLRKIREVIEQEP